MSLTSGSNRWASRAIIILQLATWNAVGIVLLHRGVSTLRRRVLETSYVAEADPPTGLESVVSSTGRDGSEYDLSTQRQSIGKNVEIIIQIDPDRSPARDDGNHSGPGTIRSERLRDAFEIVSEGQRPALLLADPPPGVPTTARGTPSSQLGRLENHLTETDDRSEKNVVTSKVSRIARDREPILGKEASRDVHEEENTTSIAGSISTKEKEEGEATEMEEDSAENATVRESNRDQFWMGKSNVRFSRFSEDGATTAIALVAIGAIMLLVGPVVIVLRILDERRQARKLIALSANARDDLPPTYEQAVLMDEAPSVDNSDYMRNGDFVPTRLQAQQDAVNLVCHSKTRSNPENNVGLITLANVEVLATLTSDVGRILSKLHQVQPNGKLALITGIRIAHLALKHRQGKNHKMRIVAFIGSPIDIDEKELVKLAKRLKKEKVNVDVISFGEESINNEVLTAFVNALNGKDGTGSHLVTVPPGPHLSDALISSPIIQGEDGMGAAGMSGAAFEFGVDPNEDPELALALRVSMEEQRQRQEDEARRAQANETAANKQPETIKEAPNEEAMLKRALAMSLEGADDSTAASDNTAPCRGNVPDFTNMTEEEQIAFAMQMSMQDQQELESQKEEAMDVEEDYAAVMSDPAFLQSVLENLPGVDPHSEAVRQAVGSLQQNKDKEKEKEKDKEKK
ncbi:PREDICTED: 26S proteasome non-ATPase regulatory subunit 4 [Vollenhovia emeryi]|uniref:26S proteasome non-ATPase regulatory subunit 4 n=1 Tax=Vollenhovia emeryi TaxID=411798 RepID=UPI0005F5069B|nr:PREDICTED: 26S proteasome non-ATPase regulatory subunit 4 [Vollenhovia emeryi]